MHDIETMDGKLRSDRYIIRVYVLRTNERAVLMRNTLRVADQGRSMKFSRCLVGTSIPVQLLNQRRILEIFPYAS